MVKCSQCKKETEARFGTMVTCGNSRCQGREFHDNAARVVASKKRGERPANATEIVMIAYRLEFDGEYWWTTIGGLRNTADVLKGLR